MLDNQALKEIQERQTRLKYYWIYGDAREQRFCNHNEAIRKVIAAALADGLDQKQAKKAAEIASREYQETINDDLLDEE